jgi:hypothetical protein
VASDGSNYLVAWPDRYSQNPTAYATRVRASDGTVLDWMPRTLAPSAKLPMAASDGSRFLVAWNTLGGEVRASRLGLEVDGTCGAVRADAAVVCRPSAVACDVAETCDGASLSCPADEPSASVPDLSGDKCEDTPCDVASYLATLGPDALEPSFGQSLQAKATAACGSFQVGNAPSTEGQLRALRNEVRAQHGKKLSASVADTLLTALAGMLGS